jgi:hypothetical protein
LRPRKSAESRHKRPASRLTGAPRSGSKGVFRAIVANPAPDWLVADARAVGQLAQVLANIGTQAAAIHAVFPANRLNVCFHLAEDLIDDLCGNRDELAAFPEILD